MDSGKIRNIGFSYHGNTENFKPVVDAFDWDFCQIQYNYLMKCLFRPEKGSLYAAEKGLPVIIMEPLSRRSPLLECFQRQQKRIAKSDVNESAASICTSLVLRSAQVTCVLSGMNSMEMVNENCKLHHWYCQVA